jgi:short-subunit dehydrogenase
MYQSVVVTGGTRGIGLAIVKRFAKEGYDIITCGRDTENGRKLVQDFKKWFPERNLHFYATDLSTPSGCKDFVNFVHALAHPILALVNNTGYFKPGSILEEPDGQLEGMINANLYSAYHLSRGLVPQMIQSGKGHVFNICSIASIMAYANGGSYSISKFAMLGMSKVLREETKKTGVKVTAVLPGAVLTDSWAGVDLPIERFIQPHDVADAIWSCYSLGPGAVVEELLIRPQLGDI